MRERWRFRIEGQVQGVGFRPFVYRLAHRLDLAGWVANGSGGVVVEVEGGRSALDDFASRLETETPTAAKITAVRRETCAFEAARDFEIRPSVERGSEGPVGLADRVTCDDCLRDTEDPSDRRYRYPFTSCTACGPRFSIIDALPYDRARTAMAGFTMCAACQAEYDDPADRRFPRRSQRLPRLRSASWPIETRPATSWPRATTHSNGPPPISGQGRPSR